uniref:ribonuclease H n=1 Tax=Lepisosteus oculatus TaxID=7918 RepID=W5NL26_LEPOC
KRIRLVAINIGTMTGRSRELANSLKERKVDIACVQETKWVSAKSREIGEGYKLIYHGKKTTQNGVGVVVNQWIRDSVTKVARITDRLMSTKICMGTSTLCVVSCYAPQAGSPEEEKDFWHDLETHVQAIDDSEILFIGGDLNGHVGRAKDNFDHNHGGQGHGNRNEGGIRVLEHAEAWDLAITNTFFKKRELHLITYYSGGRTSQIDYWMQSNPVQLHRLLVLDAKVRLVQTPAQPTTKIERIKWWKLPEHQAVVKATVGPLVPNPRSTVGEDWTDLAERVKTCAATTLGTTKPNRRFIDKQILWWNDDVQQATKAKKDTCKTWRQTKCPEDLVRYHALKSTAKRTVALYDQLDMPGVRNEINQLARACDRATQDLGHVINIKDKPKDILRRWKDYFPTKICKEEFLHPPLPAADTISGPVPTITIAEVTTAINKMKSGKAADPDDIPAEVWKLLGAQGHNKITEEKTPPETWQTSITVPICKGKGNVNDCSNYRLIRLLCHTMKFFERVLNISPNQNCGTTDAIHAARLLMERHHEKRKTINMSFLDLKKAFDRVPHDLIWLVLRQHQVPEAYVSWTKLLYQKATSSVRCSAGTSDTFPINVGVHQGSAWSPLLFILCMDTVTKDIQTRHPWTILYADDVMIASETRHGLEQQVQEWKTRLERFGMKLNIKKTEYMECGDQTSGTIAAGGVQLNKVTQFKYLGSLSTPTATFQDAKTRVSVAWMKWRQVTGVLCDKKIPLRLKSKVVRPVALYRTECWPTTKKHEQALHTMEMKMLRWTLGLTRLDHVMNEGLRVAPITEKMRKSRLRWYGHVLRSKDTSMAKTAVELKVEGRRPHGRPFTRWLDRLKDDMRLAKVTCRDAADHTKWKNRCKQADPT